MFHDFICGTAERLLDEVFQGGGASPVLMTCLSRAQFPSCRARVRETRSESSSMGPCRGRRMRVKVFDVLMREAWC
jgi:hypothetical protein